jgi:hypothetical protein
MLAVPTSGYHTHSRRVNGFPAAPWPGFGVSASTPWRDLEATGGHVTAAGER